MTETPPVPPQAETTSPRRRAALAAAAALVPVALVTAWKVFALPRPDWTPWHDPEAIHFYSSLDILHGRPPENIHTPSTVLQVLGAGIAAATGTSPFDFGAFRVTGYVVAFALVAGAAVLLARRLFAGAGAAVTLAAVWTYFVCPQALTVTNVWGPEILVFPLGVLALVAAEGALGDRRTAGRAALAGAAAGLACAQRFTFAPWVAALAVVLALRGGGAPARRIGHASAAVAGAAGGFVAGTCVAIPKYDVMFSWLTRLATRSGAYGSGESGAPSASAMWDALRARVGSSVPWHLWLAAIVALALLSLRRAPDAAARGPRRDFVVFLLVALGLEYVSATRTGILRYLLPMGVLAAALVPHAIREAARLAGAEASDAVRGARRVRAVGWCAAALAAAFLVKQARLDVIDHREVVRSSLALRAEVDRIARERVQDRPAVVLYGRPFPHPVVGYGFYADDAADRREVLARFAPCALLTSATVHLSPGATDWDLAVVREADVRKLPEPHGAIVARPDGYVVVARR